MRRNVWRRLVMLAVVAACLLGTVGNAASGLAELQVIKVGYMLNYGTVKSPIVKGSEGYGYEYLNTIVDYAERRYALQFIYCDWETGKEMLLNGELDLLGPTTYTPEGDEVYAYPKESFGDNVIFLSALKSNDLGYSSYGDINGSTIAVQENNPNEYMLHEFLEEYRIDAEIVYFTDNDYESIMEDFGYDFCLASSLQTFTNLEPVVNLGTLDFYYVTQEDNQELMDVIDVAMAEIEQKEFLYQTKLYLKYYDYTIQSENYVSDAELALLQSQEMYTVGMENLYSPICYQDEAGQFQGVAVDAMDMLAASVGIDYQIVEISPDATEEEIADVDFAFISLDGTGRENTTESDVYYEVPFFLIDRQMEEDIQTIGILTYYGITEVQMEDHLFGRAIYEFANVQEMMDSYNQGEIDSMILTTPTLNMMRGEFDDLAFLTNTLDMKLNLTILFPEGYSSAKITAINKLIAQMDEAELDASVLEHSTVGLAKTSLLQYLIENPAIIMGVLGGILLMVFLLEFKRRRALYKLLNVDTLTGLATGHQFEDVVAKTLKKSGDKQYTIMTLDIDNFKYINEFYGYEAGSQVLQKLGALLKDHATSAVCIARVSSDNFLLLMERGQLQDMVGDSFVNDNGFSTAVSPLIGDTYHITFSIGLYEIKNPTLNLNFMIDCANMARVLGKAEAASTFHKFDSHMDSKRILNNDIIANMNKAIQNDDFILYYQPKIELGSEKLIGAEALVRWKKGKTLVPPNDFIPVFEKNGFIERLDFYVLDKACQFISAHPETPRISVNLSGVTIVRDNVVQRILNLVDSYDIPHNKVDIEITETAFEEKVDKSASKFDTLRDQGFTISMDDFGTGISALNRLKNVPVDTLKVDRAFVMDSVGNPKGGKILKHIINMARDLSMETVAEGVETREQASLLTTMGCDVGQGYYFARPMPEEDFIRFITKTTT